MVRGVDARIDGINERGSSVLCILELIWQSNVGVIIGMLTMANLKLPFCKVGLSFNIGIETHILIKMKNSNSPP